MKNTFDVMFGGKEMKFQALSASGLFLIGESVSDFRKLRMVIGEQHVKEQEREQFRNCLIQMGSVAAGGIKTPDAGERVEAGRIGRQSDDKR